MNDETEEQTGSVVNIGTEAMLELEELSQKVRTDAPSLSHLLDLLRKPTPSPTFAGNSGMSMLADMRVYTVLRDATGVKVGANYRDYEKTLNVFLEKLETGVATGKLSEIQKAKSFCKTLVNSLVARNIRDIYERRESSDARYISNAASRSI